MNKLTLISFLFLAFFLLSCGHDKTEAIDDSLYTITILDHMFVPDTVTVPPGETIFFINRDGMPHQILSQSGENLFDDTGLFESEIIIDGDTSYINVPEDAQTGDVLFFYDGLLIETMHTPNGIITIEL
ncbi:MAG: cupredoxin domain-containing protein [bacterium]|nr:cupredoxin domain-containing protein [bacterium]MBU1916936.1 cupredoxin domain-containing protein [bacterium]